MAKQNGWAPKNFSDVISKLDSASMLAALRVVPTRTCPAPVWDSDGTYRVALVGGVPRIQRLINGGWGPAPLEPWDLSGSVSSEARLFISHSSKDGALAKLLTDLMDGVLAVPRGAMRCTSVPGYKLEPGADGPDELRRNLRSAKVVVGLLSEQSLASAFVLMELGAAWGLGSHVIPVLSGVDFAKIPGPIGAGIHAVEVDDAAGMASVVMTVSRRCEFERRGSEEHRFARIKEFASKAGKRR